MQITVNISGADQKILENDLLDIDDWVQKTVIGKVNSCRKRIIIEAPKGLKADTNIRAIPVDDSELIIAFMAMPSYKNRAMRQAEDDKA